MKIKDRGEDAIRTHQIQNTKVVLYKYRAHSDFTAKIVLDKSVYLAKPEELNDPCEGEFQEISKEWLEKEREILMRNFVSATSAHFALLSQGRFPDMNSLADVSLDEAFERCRKYQKDVLGWDQARPEEIFKGLPELRANAGIFSMSSQCTSLAMWAYYANNHEGVCFGFETDPAPPIDVNVFEKVVGKVHKVVYSETVPGLTEHIPRWSVSNYEQDGVGGLRWATHLSFGDKTVRLSLTTKHPDWSHEDEYRYVEEKTGIYPWPGPMKECIFGLRCPGPIRQLYADLVRQVGIEDVNFFEITKLTGTYRLIKAPIPTYNT